MKIYSLLKSALNIEFEQDYTFLGYKFKLTSLGFMCYNDGVWTEMSVEDELVSKMLASPDDIEMTGMVVKQNQFYWYVSGTGKIQRKRYRSSDMYAEQLKKNYNLFHSKEQAALVASKVTILFKEAHYDI